MKKIKTHHVEGRRVLRFQSVSDILDEANRLASGDVRLLGNWSLGQILRHLAYATDGSIDGFVFRVTWIERFVIHHFYKQRMITEGIPPGHGQSWRWKSVKAGPATTTEEGITALRKAMARYATDPRRSTHPCFGTFTPEQWDLFHMRHAELHLSFALPVDGQF